MNDQKYILSHLAGIFHTGVFGLQEDKLSFYEESPEYNPIYNNETLRLTLICSADAQREPAVISDEFRVFYICIKWENVYYMMGPLSTQVMGRTVRHRFFHFYGIDEKWEKGLHYHTLMEILQITGMFAKIITGQEYTDQQLVDANYQAVSRIKEQQEQAWFDIKSNVEEAIRLSKEMDANIGRLGESEVEHWRNLSIVAVTLCARAAIEAGVMPATAYRLSGFYINKSTACKDITQILIYRNHAIEELVKRVREQKQKHHTSSYTRRCKDYVYEHYREKIYLDDISDAMGISSNYLSRLFKKETGTSLQDFINDIRVEKAANLLVYSEEPLAKIAEYVNFPSQSYFGKIFKQKMKTTPKQYRELYKPTEFYARTD